MSAPRQRHSGRSQSKPQPASRHTAARQPELIDPRWLLKALGLVLGVALLLAWGTLCLLWYQGQWQLVLHPSRTVGATPASLHLQFTPLRFGVDATGAPQLSGWYIPADNATASTPSALMLHGGDGSIADALPQALTLHNAGLNVVLFDYRGFGASAGGHPTEDSMQTDAASALTWLATTQHVAPRQTILYGNGIGASLAVQLAAQHPNVAAIVLEAPDGDLTARVAHDPHSRLVPARLLFNQIFPLAEPLRALATPKLLIAYTSAAHPPAALTNAADPKLTVELPSRNDPALLTSIERFLSLYVTHEPLASAS